MEHTLELTLRTPPAEAWAFLADTNAADRAAGLPAIAYRDEPQPDGTTRRFFRYRLRGLPVEGEEQPFTWEFPHRFEVVRRYERGPFAAATHACELVPHGDGTRAVHTFSFEPRGLLGRIFAWGFGREVLPALRAFWEARDSEAGGGQQAPERAPRRAPRGASDTGRIATLQEQARTVYDAEPVEAIADLIASAPDEEVERLRPRSLARAWDQDEREVLNSLLATTQVGLTRLRWDVICPHCRGDKENLDHLAALGEKAFCPSCNIDFDLDLDRAVEAVFVPHPAARRVETAKYCLGGPGLTPHILAQSLVPPGGTWAPTLTLPAGRYRVRFTGAPAFRWLEVEPGGVAAAELRITDEGLEGDDPRLPAAGTGQLTVQNRSSRPVIVVVEDVSWAQDALPAGHLVADQRFRELFSGEMLAPGVRLAIESVTIVFTDLVGSTAMYGALGDARAFNLVLNHFDVLRDVVAERGGAIIKTIGDAIMAVFMQPEAALLAAADLHERLSAHLAAAGHDYPASLKVGMHTGPAIAVTLNERLDYFGSTVNLAARTEGQSLGEDIVVTASTLGSVDGDPLVARGWAPEPFDASVKGFAGPVAMIRYRRV